ncbi:hypothetical protein SynBIOSE41_03430 [Synechococcus sp. BIOS-E4-1]|uniref:hypothetical protein n=1 Tax=Synechococcus sp. BIOS-E4-1 TaxID=1400864 RepID=UPI0016457BE0|nr:hypothetical protein [Synechococcus sp. BIOS-E4-1]QNI55903.1 hypothetical protein SynBIOSE41_03430 [Synechococcus sp. BIOS-E4-1]
MTTSIFNAPLQIKEAIPTSTQPELEPLFDQELEAAAGGMYLGNLDRVLAPLGRVL